MMPPTFALILAILAVALVSPGPDVAAVTWLTRLRAAWPGAARAPAVPGARHLAWLGVQCLRPRG